MHKYKIAIGIFIAILIVGLSVSGYYLYKNFSKPIKDLANLSKTNFPGQLLGPVTSDRAKSLDPDKIIYWTNQNRQDNNLPALEKNDLLTQAAKIKADDMFAKQYFEHVSPSDVKPSDVVSSTGYNFKITGENLALGDFTSEQDLVTAWMNSPGHRANILNKDYTEIGVASKMGKFEDRALTWISVQEFGAPQPNCTKPDEATLDDINSKKAQYESLINQINYLSAEVSSLNSQANDAIKQGNDIYASTQDKTQAQTYWTQGDNLRNQAETKTAEANKIKTQADDLYTTIQTESNAYNTQVNTYNSCIKQ